MAGELAGRVAIVTGAGRGIGQAIAQALAAAGAAVVVTARAEDQLRQAVAAIEGGGGRALAVAGDVADPATVAQTVRAAEDRFGPVDVLVNNAATLGPDGGVADSDAAEWWRAFAVNLYAPFLWSQAVLVGMLARRRGHIIHVASNGGVIPLHRGEAYNISKTALIRLAEGMAAETCGQGVAVFAISPGTVWTQMSREFMGRSPEVYPGAVEDPTRYTPIPPEAPARLCVALASGRADALSGRYIRVVEDLEALIGRADEIREQDLYTLRLRT